MPDRFRLLSHYRTPTFRYGQRVECLARGEVRIVGMSDAPIQWPIGAVRGGKSPVLFGSLVKAVKTEAARDIKAAWGVGATTVQKWRRALGVRRTKGERNRRVKHANSPVGRRKVAAMHAKARDPERRAKIAAAKRGKPRAAKVRAALLRAHKGKPLSVDVRKKMSRTHRKRGTRPPWINDAWTVADDEAIRTLAPAEAAKQTGRTLRAVYVRRNRIGLPDGRRRK